MRVDDSNGGSLDSADEALIFMGKPIVFSGGLEARFSPNLAMGAALRGKVSSRTEYVKGSLSGSCPRIARAVQDLQHRRPV